MSADTLSRLESALLGELSEEQQRVVTTVGWRFVNAGAGAGKTRCLTYSVLYDIGVRRVDAHEVMVCTFTRAAARELRTRIRETAEGLGLDPRRLAALNIDTIDSCLPRALARHGRHVPRLCSDLERLHCQQEAYVLARALHIRHALKLERLFCERNGRRAPERPDSPGQTPEAQLRAAIVAASEFRRAATLELPDPGCLPRPSGRPHALRRSAAKLILEYESQLREVLKRRGAWGGADVLDAAAAQPPRAFQRVYVDEVQDCTLAQFDALSALVTDDGELVAAGQFEQAIYGFRHTTPELLVLRLSSAPFTAVELRENRRSTSAIVELTNNFMATSKALSDGASRMTAARQGASPVLVPVLDLAGSPAATRLEISAYVARLVATVLPRAAGWAPIAVLASYNDQCVALVQALRRAGVCARWDPRAAAVRNGWNHALAAYALALSSSSHDCSGRELQVVLEHLGGLAAADAQTLATTHPSLTDVLRAAAEPRLQEPLGELARTHRNAPNPDDYSPAQFLRAIENHYSVIANADRLNPTGTDGDCIEAYLQAAEQIERRHGHTRLGTLVQYVEDNLYLPPAETATEQLPEWTVGVFTHHQAKGLGWPVVIVPFLSDFTATPKRPAISLHAADGVAEVAVSYPGRPRQPRDPASAAAIARRAQRERAEAMRKLYVAMTRARNCLVLVSQRDRRASRAPADLEAAIASTATARVTPVPALPTAVEPLPADRRFTGPQRRPAFARATPRTLALAPQALTYTRAAATLAPTTTRDVVLRQALSRDDGARLHRLMCKAVREYDLDLSKVVHLADNDEVRRVLETLAGVDLLRNLCADGQAVAEAKFSYAVNGRPVRGRADLVVWRDDRPTVYDWKSGHCDPAAEELQRRLYACALLTSGAKAVTCRTLHVAEPPFLHHGHSNLWTSRDLATLQAALAAQENYCGR
jgi:ATP-dependent exoDNAse (exonuclease V) beta subunit